MQLSVTVIGCGAMGRAAARVLAHESDVARIRLVDRDTAAIKDTGALLADLNTHTVFERGIESGDDAQPFSESLKSADFAILALPWGSTVQALRAAAIARCPAVSITRPDYGSFESLQAEILGLGGQVILPLGLEPGLTELLARHAVQSLDGASALQVYCGGIADTNSAELPYKVVFGGRLPVPARQIFQKSSGSLCQTGLFDGFENLTLPHLGQLEAYHDGLLPWMAKHPAFEGLSDFTQKTLRRPGFTHVMRVLSSLGLLSLDAIDVGDAQVVPRRVVEVVTEHLTRWRRGDQDTIVVRAVASTGDAEPGGRCARYECQIVGRGEPATGLTAMALATGGTAAQGALQCFRTGSFKPGIQWPIDAFDPQAAKQLLCTLGDLGLVLETGQVLSSELA